MEKERKEDGRREEEGKKRAKGTKRSERGGVVNRDLLFSLGRVQLGDTRDSRTKSSICIPTAAPRQRRRRRRQARARTKKDSTRLPRGERENSPGAESPSPRDPPFRANQLHSRPAVVLFPASTKRELWRIPPSSNGSHDRSIDRSIHAIPPLPDRFLNSISPSPGISSPIAWRGVRLHGRERERRRRDGTNESRGRRGLAKKFAYERSALFATLGELFIPN